MSPKDFTAGIRRATAATGPAVGGAAASTSGMVPTRRGGVLIASPSAKRCADCPATFAPGSTRRRCRPCQAAAVRARDRARDRAARERERVRRWRDEAMACTRRAQKRRAA